MKIKVLEPIHFAILSGMNRIGRRKFYKEKHKEFNLISWPIFNSLPGIWKSKPIISEKDKFRVGFKRRKRIKEARKLGLTI